MVQQLLTVGAGANDGTGDQLRGAGVKINSNFAELYSGLGGVIAKSGASSAHTGDATETVLGSILIPANTLGANGILRVSSFWSMTASANVKNIRHRLGGTGINGSVIFSAAPGAVAVTATRVESMTIAANATNAQNTISIFPRGSDLLVTEAAVVASALDMTVDQSLFLTGQLVTTSETITLLGYVVEAIK